MKFDLRRAATLTDPRAFLAGAAGHDFEPVSWREAYGFIRELLRRFPYDRLYWTRILRGPESGGGTDAAGGSGVGAACGWPCAGQLVRGLGAGGTGLERVGGASR